MTATQTAGSPALYSGPFNTLHSLRIDRGNYIAVHSNNPAAAAQYAVDNMGFYLVHADSEGRHVRSTRGPACRVSARVDSLNACEDSPSLCR